MRSVLSLCLLFFAIFGEAVEAGYDYYSTYWVVDQGTCRNSYGEVYFCIHYSNCYPKGYFRNQSGQTKLCGFYYDKIIMCCIEDDNFSQDDSFLNYFLQKHKYPFSTTQKSGVIRTHYKWIGFPNGILKDQYARTGNSHSTISSVVTSTEDNLQAPGTTEIVYTSPGVNDMKLSEQTTSTEEAYVITNTSKDKGDLVTTESIQRNTINAENTNILTTPKVDKNRSTLLITNVTFYQNIAPEKAGILNNSTQNPIVKVNGEENSLIAPEEITTANSKDVSITNDSVDIDKVIASIFIRDSDAFTARPNLVQNQSDSAVGENISETQMQKIILENTTKSTQEDNTTEQVQTSTISTNIHPLTTTPAIVIPLYSLNANLEESILSEDNQFSIRSSSSQIERNDVQENLSQSEIDGGITIPKYAPVLENSTSLRKCRDVYGDAKRDVAWRHRSSNKALLGYGEENDIEWLCSGSLISEMFVLTAARCQYNDTNPAKFVQLGSSETSSQIIKRGIQNFTVADFILHPLYGTSQNNHYDLALVKLNTSAIYTDYVKPACLSTTPDLGTVPLWLPHEVPIHYIHISNEICRTIYNDTENTISGTLQICAVTDSFFKCQYDLGAPLVYVNTHYSFGYFPEIRGIASFGEPCTDKPAVCTKVLAYVSWIESIVWKEG